MSLNGIDISNHQGRAGINIGAVPFDFVICKATEGTTYVDAYCDKFVQKAIAMGKLWGVYHFATGKSSGVAEADFFLKNIQGYIGKGILVLDWESTAVPKGPSYAKAFLDRVYQKTGVRPLIYMSNSVIHSYDWSSVVAGNYGLWNAGYYAGYREMGYNPNAPIYGGLGEFGTCAMYQYTSSGRLSGYNGPLDLDVFYGDAKAWNAYAKANGVPQTPVSPSPVQPGAPANPPNQSILNAQIHINNFTNAGIPEDGLNGPKTRVGAVKVLQTALNLDYEAGLKVDGDIGPLTDATRGSHYVRLGETQYMVTAAEIFLTLLGYYSGPVESPGVFGNGMYDAVGDYQEDRALNNDHIAGRNTFDRMLSDIGCI